MFNSFKLIALTLLTLAAPAFSATNLCGFLGNGVTSVFDSKVTILDYNWYKADAPPNNVLYCDNFCPSNAFVIQLDGDITVAECRKGFGGVPETPTAEALEMQKELKEAQRRSCGEAMREVVETTFLEEFIGIEFTGDEAVDQAKSKIEEIISGICEKFATRYTSKLKMFGPLTKWVKKVADKTAEYLCGKIAELISGLLPDKLEKKVGDEIQEVIDDVMEEVSELICDAVTAFDKDFHPDNSVTGYGSSAPPSTVTSTLAAVAAVLTSVTVICFF